MTQFIRPLQDCKLSKIKAGSLRQVIKHRVIAGIDYFGVLANIGLVWFSQKECIFSDETQSVDSQVKWIIKQKIESNPVGLFRV